MCQILLVVLVVLVVSDPVGCAGGAGCVLLSDLMLPGGVAAVAGVPVGACLCFTRFRVWCFFLLYGKIQAGRRLVFGFC